MKRGWFPPKVDPTKVGALVTAAPPAVAAVVFAIQSKDAAAWGTAVTAVLSVGVILGVVRPNVTPSTDPRDIDGTALKRPDGTLPKGAKDMLEKRRSTFKRKVAGGDS